MRIPVPTNRLVAFTLAGALLTTAVAAGLAFPGLGLGEPAGMSSDRPAESQQATADAPSPNQDFTPAVQTQSGYDEEHQYEYDEHDEYEGEAEHGEYEEREGDEEHEEEAEASED